MTGATTHEALLAAASVHPAVHQRRRTQLTAATTRALFIVDALGPDALATATDAGDDLERRLRVVEPAVATARRLIAAPRA